MLIVKLTSNRFEVLLMIYKKNIFLDKINETLLRIANSK
jgi:hypothetical protein